MTASNRLFIVWACILSLISCTSMKPVPPEETNSKIQFKDRIIIYEKSGRIIDMKVVSVEQDRVTGSLVKDPLTSVTIPFADIEKVEVESIDGGMTTLAVLGGIVLLPFLLLGAMFGVMDSVDSH
ncbi:hypothetical protein [Kangiella sediminilitoris]|uniref:Lipoprotein n=1 Tax=Kangiella sediminilitoris TaxID=1144748 RepID=A0A1B3BC29_9GAMM|nr:hypothetical protein [Kangiella sediminilitoris]AOE50369.1 hypothetical protein KS2013_1659 [Kangiella sediminilitoris]